MLEVAVVDQTPQVGAIGRGNWNEIDVIHYWGHVAFRQNGRFFWKDR
jgi:hypothetical protein